MGQLDEHIFWMSIFLQTERLVTGFEKTYVAWSYSVSWQTFVIFDTKEISLLECLTITRDKNL